VTCLLEEARAARLGLTELLRRLAIRVGEKLAGLVPRRVHDLGALPLALLPEALDLALAARENGLLAADLLLRTRELRRGCPLRVPLEHVGEFGGPADEVQRVHPHGVARGIDLRALPGRLEHPELGLELHDVAPK
jgi:hypothetical protein